MAVTLPVPARLMNAWAYWMPSDRVVWVLSDEVGDWLDEQNMHVYAEYENTEEGYYYTLVFETVSDATLFKLRWF